jgi:hypothetical protein
MTLNQWITVASFAILVVSLAAFFYNGIFGDEE